MPRRTDRFFFWLQIYDTRTSLTHTRKIREKGKEMERKRKRENENRVSNERNTHFRRTGIGRKQSDSRFQGGCAHQRPLKVVAQCARVPISTILCFPLPFSFYHFFFNFPSHFLSLSPSLSLSLYLSTVYLPLFLDLYFSNFILLSNLLYFVDLYLNI